MQQFYSGSGNYGIKMLSENSECKKGLAPCPWGIHDCPNLYMLSSDAVTKYGRVHGEHLQGAHVRQCKQRGSEQTDTIYLREDMT